MLTQANRRTAVLNTTDIVMAEIAGGTGITLRQAAAMLPPTRRRAR
jgi:hypothetical protein